MKCDKLRNNASKLVILSFLISLANLTSMSQTRSQGQDFSLPSGIDQTVPGVVQPQGVALESTIDPKEYFVGPSDGFSVNIWVSPPLSASLTVTPEGTLIVPTVGEVKVADMTLAEAKKRVIERIKSKYLGSLEPTVTLVTPRQIVVTVTGNVLNAGSYILSAFHRANKAIEQANKLQVPQTQADLQLVLSTMSTRNITVKHKDGSFSHVDITKFLATKADRWNPYLREGDFIIVLRNDLLRNVFGVYGEVNLPGRYEFVQGDSVKDALLIAQGFTSQALKDSIEFSRLGFDGQTMTSSILDGEAILTGLAPDLPMQPGDRIVVRSLPDLRADYIVIVEGEVKFPGTYPITKSRTLLSEIVRKAGGFTEFASVGTGQVIRKSVRPADIQLERLESARGGVEVEDSSYYYLETDLRIQKELVTVDFDKLFLHGDSTQDVFLQDGDIVHVPSRHNTIYVFGQVASPGHIPFAQGEDADYYIEKAGGFTDRARSGDVKIVKAKTRQWLSPDETSVEENDYIWIPKEIDHPFGFYLNIIGQTAAVISVAVSLVLLVVQTNK